MMRFSDAGTPDADKTSRCVDKHVVEQALRDMDLVVDLIPDDLQRLFTLTLQHAEKQQLVPQQIRLGHCYTNGRHGTAWSLRRIIDESSSDDPRKDMMIYRVVEGQGHTE